VAGARRNTIPLRVRNPVKLHFAKFLNNPLMRHFWGAHEFNEAVMGVYMGIYGLVILDDA
jgi:hypothetical protein